MSNHVSGLCYKAKFGCPKRKAIAVAMGDHAHDDGTNIFPSVKRLAKKVEWSERTVQRVLRELEECGVLIVVSQGGSGPKDTREWSFNMELLRDLADDKAEIVAHMGDSESPIEDDSLAPLVVVRVSTGQLWVTGTTDKGDSADTRTIINPHQPSGARASASDKDARSAPAKTTATAAFEIFPGDASWSDWISHLRDNGDSERADRAVAAGKMVVSARWPRTVSAKVLSVPSASAIRGKMFAAGDA